MEARRVKHKVVPSAKRLINSLRNMSYDFVKAVADLIDNSIQANATEVAIQMKFNGENSWLRITDNGHGMSPDELTEAMRYGSEKDYGPNELGRYGLGMKTASFSQCRKLTVASRTSLTEDISIRQWDLDIVDETNTWEVDEIPPEEYYGVVTDPLQNQVGTVVLWEHLDRLLHFKPPDGKRAMTWFNKTADELDLHLGMVFHRFLSGEVEGRELRITLNGSNIISWDPFARKEPKTTILSREEFYISDGGKIAKVVCSPYILPAQSDFSSQTAFRRSSGPKKWNAQQGFYIYRGNRMIQAGGWCGMRSPEEHAKLARIALDVGSDSDQVLMLDVTKSTVQLPADLKERLKPLIASLVGEAERHYRTSNHEPSVAKPSFKANENINKSNKMGGNIKYDNLSPDSKTKKTETSSDSEGKHFSSGEPKEALSLGQALERTAEKVGEKDALLKIKIALKKEDPSSAYSLGW
jgi:hypothetical protein